MGNRLWRLTLLISLCAINLHCSFASKRSTASVTPTTKHGPLMWPLAGHNRISKEFVTENTGSPHDGIDIPAPSGTRIYAPADGRVVYAGQKFKGYGNMIIIEHSSLLTTIYGHCRKLFVRQGDRIRRGSLIAQVGNTGRSTAPHLHFEVRRQYRPVNPLEYVQ